MNVEIIGHVGGALIAISLLPQILKSWRTKSTQDISLLWTSTLLIGLLIMVFYATAINSLPIMIFGTIEALFTLSLLVLKLRYR